jgi:hypothetical protein
MSKEVFILRQWRSKLKGTRVGVMYGQNVGGKDDLNIPRVSYRKPELVFTE